MELTVTAVYVRLIHYTQVDIASQVLHDTLLHEALRNYTHKLCKHFVKYGTLQKKLCTRFANIREWLASVREPFANVREWFANRSRTFANGSRRL